MQDDPAAFAAAWRHALAQSPWFRTNAATWTHGTLSLQIDPDPSPCSARAAQGEAWRLLLDVHEGELRALGPCTADEARAARFRLKAPRATWCRVLAGELDPMKAILEGHVHLAGRLGELAPFVRAAQELAQAARAALKNA